MAALAGVPVNRGDSSDLVTMAGNNEDIDAQFGEQSETRPLLMGTGKSTATKTRLPMFIGVTMPCILSIFSVLLFLRMGYVLGQAGFLVAVLTVVLSYSVVILTVLSLSAISTSGNIKAGGVYFMISRSLGPEFGGSIGVIFYFANVLGSALNVSGATEAIFNNFGQPSNGQGSLLKYFHQEFNATLVEGIPESYGIRFAIATAILALCGVICLVGAGMFAKATGFIFAVVIFALASVMISFGAVGPMLIQVDNGNTTEELKYSSWDLNTFSENLLPKFSRDYTTGNIANFQTVFAIMFTGVTGIMAGANISGDLRHPSTAIPQGTLLACAITFVVYVIIFVFSAMTSSRELLLNDYNYLQDASIFPPFITLGVFAATFSAALSCLIGAAKILNALAKDRLFGRILHVFSIGFGKKQEPIFAVLISWFFVQLISLVDKLNYIAPACTIFFLLSYAAVNMACLALKMASAPNFRPTFQAYSRTTALLGIISSLAMMFVVQYAYAGAALALSALLFVGLLLFGPPTAWGDVSQALIFYQVRKFLLRLDVRKSHIKFWRPQILLLVANPRSAYTIIDFINDLKKGGLYVLGHVIKGSFDKKFTNKQKELLPIWLNLIDSAKVKAFAEITVSPSFRLGAQSLLMTTGLGGMKPNTLAVGFYSGDLPLNCLYHCEQALRRIPKAIRIIFKDDTLIKFSNVQISLPQLRTTSEEQTTTPEEYCQVLTDAILLGKNLLIMRHFETFNKSVHLKQRPFIDVWPLKVTDGPPGKDYTRLLVLQLSTVLHMVSEWRSLKMRVYVAEENSMTDSAIFRKRQTMEGLLQELRIEADVHVVNEGHWDHVGGLEDHDGEYYEKVNTTIRQHSLNACVVFISLPPPPDHGEGKAEEYLHKVTQLTNGLPPTVLVHGSTPVISTSM